MCFLFFLFSFLYSVFSSFFPSSLFFLSFFLHLFIFSFAILRRLNAQIAYGVAGHENVPLSGSTSDVTNGAGVENLKNSNLRNQKDSGVFTKNIFFSLYLNFFHILTYLIR